MHRYLRHCQQRKPLKLCRQPRLTAAQQHERLEFARARLNWPIQEWRRVFSDEPPFEIYTRRTVKTTASVRAYGSLEVPVTETVKQSTKVVFVQSDGLGHD